MEQSLEVAAHPTRVWELVSTGGGISSWFVTADVVPGHSGSVTLRFGPGAEGTMPIRRWEPPRRIRFGAAEGEPGRAHDFEITESPGGSATMRVVDDGLEVRHTYEARRTWAGYLSKLKIQAERA